LANGSDAVKGSTNKLVVTAPAAADGVAESFEAVPRSGETTLVPPPTVPALARLELKPPVPPSPMATARE
jgi:hypothetical protein